MGGAGDPPAPVGDPPTGTAASNFAKRWPPTGSSRHSLSVRRVAGRNRRVACATSKPFFKRALRRKPGLHARAALTSCLAFAPVKLASRGAEETFPARWHGTGLSRALRAGQPAHLYLQRRQYIGAFRFHQHAARRAA